MVMLTMLGSVALIAIYLWQVGYYPEFWTSLRFAAFNVVSVASTTGFANTDYNVWPIFAPLWMLYLSLLRDLVGLDRGRHQDDPRARAAESCGRGSSPASSTRAPRCRSRSAASRSRTT